MSFSNTHLIFYRLLIALVLVIVSLLPQITQAATVKDSLGSHEFLQPATRVVTLNWGSTEEVLELGVTPVGVADINGYKTWVARPEIPTEVVDVGTRAEPSIERLAELKPDLIVVGSMQQDMVARLSPIAPVLFFDNYRADHSNIDAIEHSFRQLAIALGKQDVAEKRLMERQEKLARLKEEVNQHFNGAVPNVSVIRFSDANHVRAYGSNSMPLAALKALGIDAAIEIPSSTWGQVQKPIRELAYMDGILLYIRPLPHEEQLFSQPLFRMMPVVAEGRIAPVKPTWTYGGALSIGYLAEHFVESLTKLPTELNAASSGDQH
ncbi:iron-siderophore ABC transporter substrate-binding protein [Oceanospirillum sp.]|uniref:iron-siderophore ABC transporter substrate-binding protein n=1 Tax=Oceanospirillum sp. TaxID=2021254 RepID=UPI003A906990